MKIFILFIIATLSTTFGSNVDSIYVKGNEHYLQSEFNYAIENYEKILSLNREHQDLYFNLGNAYFRNKEVGNAIWSYEKAKLFSPRDKDINFNLNFLNGQIQDKILKPNQLFFIKFYNSLLNKYNFGELFGMLGVIILFLSFKRIINIKNDFLRKSYKLSIVISSFFILFFVFSLMDKAFKITNTKEAIVISNEINVKSSPFLASKNTIFKIHEGTKVIIGENQQEWYQIELYDGKKGWVLGSQIRPI